MPYGSIMRRVSPTLVTPRYFDLSPYFEIVKFNVIENLRFDYRKILWADEEERFRRRNLLKLRDGENSGPGSCIERRTRKEYKKDRRELLEKAIAKILHRHCNFGWANYYIPSEKFPSLIEEWVEALSPGGQVGHDAGEFPAGDAATILDSGARGEAGAGIFGIQARLKLPLND